MSQRDDDRRLTRCCVLLAVLAASVILVGVVLVMHLGFHVNHVNP